MLDGLTIVNLFLGTVYPPEAESNLHGIDIPYHAGTVISSPVHAQPEVTHFVVIILVPSVQLISGVYV